MMLNSHEPKKLKAFHVNRSEILCSDPSNYSIISQPDIKDNLKTVRPLRQLKPDNEPASSRNNAWKMHLQKLLLGNKSGCGEESISNQREAKIPKVGSSIALPKVFNLDQNIDPFLQKKEIPGLRNQGELKSYPRGEDLSPDSNSIEKIIPAKRRLENHQNTNSDEYLKLKAMIKSKTKNFESIAFEDKCKLMALAASYGDLDTIQYMVDFCDTHPGIKNNIAIIEASKAGQLHIVQYLLKDPKVNPIDQKHYAMKMAVQHGNLDVLECLLGYPKTDPTFDNNYAIRTSSINGYTEMVKRLLKDSRVDPSVKDYYPIRHAAKNGHMDVVRLLLLDHRVNKTKVFISANKNKKAFANLIMILQNEFSMS